jgi:hypothetical protein
MAKSQINIDYVKLAGSIGLSLMAGIIGGVFTSQSIPTWYATLTKPEWNPPNWVFGPVWTILYILMGISLYLLWTTIPKTPHHKKTTSPSRGGESDQKNRPHPFCYPISLKHTLVHYLFWPQKSWPCLDRNHSPLVRHRRHYPLHRQTKQARSLPPRALHPLGFLRHHPKPRHRHPQLIYPL